MVNAAFDNVEYFLSCRKIFFLFKVSRMDMCLWCGGTYRGVCWSKFVALFPRLSSPGEIWRARHPGQRHILLVQVTGSWCNVLPTVEVSTFTISTEGTCWNGLPLSMVWLAKNFVDRCPNYSWWDCAYLNAILKEHLQRLEQECLQRYE